jgi:hypothetical protein
MKNRPKALIFIGLTLTFLTTPFSACSQKTVTTSTAPFNPVVKNDSMVTAKIVEVQDGDGAIPWVLTIQLRTSQNVSGYPNYTTGKIGQTIVVRCMETGQLITAHLRFEGDETSSFYFIWAIQ